ncbi:dolichyl-phosphate-mannose protein mannosyltransferase, putative [Plasmodium reichenowi]|uniref:Dolichyl-phosphate-mannose protein mannosyltransferase, putative n=3 Tax=Plasmodium reichenowi TaxID=5854 RepID=A0A060RTC7_PLARE|nr:dolichyl-phosphate-mannose protein mannosyltransferase, putative [Plasmodium reichenowi]SOV79696.1 dolichyl-phosphate-mannose protein mannosyltransferase, putative [Plasmodium reichenowi]
MINSNLFVFFLLSLFLSKICTCLYVTDGSSIILENIGTKYKLFSTDMKWGTGSGNQLVTAVTTNKNEDDLLWTVSLYEEEKSVTGRKINCDEIVTLKHVKSNGYLIGSKHDSILSNNYELSVHKDNEYGKFQVVCEKKKNTSYWEIGENVYLKNINQNGYLSTSKSYEFNQYNCHNCPIMYHLEACILKYSYPRDDQKWRAKSGVIIANFSDDKNEKVNRDEL